MCTCIFCKENRIAQLYQLLNETARHEFLHYLVQFDFNQFCNLSAQHEKRLFAKQIYQILTPIYWAHTLAEWNNFIIHIKSATIGFIYWGKEKLTNFTILELRSICDDATIEFALIIFHYRDRLQLKSFKIEKNCKLTLLVQLIWAKPPNDCKIKFICERCDNVVSWTGPETKKNSNFPN